MMLAYYGLQSRAQVAQQVPAIRHMTSRGCPAPDALPVHLSPITGDNLHTRMGAQPGGNGGSLAVRKEIDNSVPLQIHDDGAVGAPSAPRPLVDADHTRRGGCGGGGRANHPQQGVRAERHREAPGQTGASLSSQRQAKMTLHIPEAPGPAGVGGSDRGHSFAEGAPLAGWIGAGEPPQAQAQENGPSLPGQVR
jgi:hypothetical protein